MPTARDVPPCDWIGGIPAFHVDKTSRSLAFPAEEAEQAQERRNQGRVPVRRQKKVGNVSDEIGGDHS
eukprot:1117808-Pyramimonas_sp.AAC.1